MIQKALNYQSLANNLIRPQLLFTPKNIFQSLIAAKSSSHQYPSNHFFEFSTSKHQNQSITNSCSSHHLYHRNRIMLPLALLLILIGRTLLLSIGFRSQTFFNQYTKSSTREKEWFLEKKLLHQEILKLKQQLQAMQRLNVNLNNRIKLLQNALKRQKLIKNPNLNTKQQKKVDQTRTIQEIEQYFQKNGWNLSQKPKSLEQNSHKQFLSKVMEEVGIKFDKIEQRCRKMQLTSENEKNIRTENGQKFQTLINELNKVSISSNIKINAHLDSVRGIIAMSNSQSQTLLVSVSEDCLVKLWNIDSRNKEKSEIEPISCFRQHTGQLFTIDGGTLTEGTNDLVLFTAGTQEYAKIWYAESRQKPQGMKCIGWLSNEKHEDRSESQELQNQIIWSLKYKDKRLLTSASDGIIRLFDVSINYQQNRFNPQIKLLNQFSEKGYIQTAIQWVGDRGILSGCASSPKINLWDVETAKIVQKYTYEIQKVKQDKNQSKKQGILPVLFQANSIKYHSDYKLIYAGCEDKSIKIFSYDQNKMIKRLNTGINDSISCLDLYKNNFIVAGCQDSALKVWDRRMYKLVIDELGHRTKYDEGILCLRTTESGIFTGGADGVVNFYTV